jgi:hypothetical protein
MSPDYFHELSDVFADASGSQPNRAAIGEVMQRHGLTPA